jgi:hypothetical protein
MIADTFFCLLIVVLVLAWPMRRTNPCTWCPAAELGVDLCRKSCVAWSRFVSAGDGRREGSTLKE